MSLLNLVSLDDDQVEIIITAVKDWCEQNGVSIDDENGRQAMSIALSGAKTGKPTCLELSDLIERAAANRQ